MSPTKKRMSRDDWTEAALDAMADQGAAGINVEELARTLGTTKGSFYHHFENRRALLDAALERWEALIRADIEAASDVVDPTDRLIELALSGATAKLNGFVDLALAASMDDPSVAASVKRANEERLQALDSVFADLGVKSAEQRTHSIQALASYLGLFQLQHMTGERFSGEQLRDLVVRTATAAID